MPPPGGWRKRHQQAARRHGNELRAQGARALYNDSVRWWAHRKFQDRFLEAAGDPTFQLLWQFRRDKNRDTRLAALEELGMLTKDDDGTWRYSDAYLAWLFEEVA